MNSERTTKTSGPNVSSECSKGEELTKKASSIFSHPDKPETEIMERVYQFFQSTTPREKLLLWMLWELQSASGHTSLDVANTIMRDLDEKFDVGDDPELNCLKEICEGLELLNTHS